MNDEKPRHRIPEMTHTSSSEYIHQWLGRYQKKWYDYTLSDEYNIQWLDRYMALSYPDAPERKTVDCILSIDFQRQRFHVSECTNDYFENLSNHGFSLFKFSFSGEGEIRKNSLFRELLELFRFGR